MLEQPAHYASKESAREPAPWIPPMGHWAILDSTALQDLDAAAILSLLPFPETLEAARRYRDELWPDGVLVHALTWEPVPLDEAPVQALDDGPVQAEEERHG